VAPFGEAAMLQPPLMATAFNEVLEYCEVFEDGISKAISATDGIPLFPHSFYPRAKRAQDELQLLIARVMIAGDVLLMDRVIRILDRLPKRTLFKFFSSELSWADLALIAPRLILASRR